MTRCLQFVDLPDNGGNRIKGLNFTNLLREIEARSVGGSEGSVHIVHLEAQGLNLLKLERLCTRCTDPADRRMEIDREFFLSVR